MAVTKRKGKTINSTASTNKGSSGAKAQPPAVLAAVVCIALVLVVSFLFSSRAPSLISSSSETGKESSSSSSSADAKRKRPKPRIVAAHGEVIESRWWDVPCAKTRSAPITGCTPTTRCGRFLTDVAFEESELQQLKSMAKKWMKLGGAAGGPTILDLHSGALSYEDQFIDVYQEVARRKADVYDPSDFSVYKKIKNTIKRAVEGQFEIGPGLVHLTSPTFFSEISDRPARTEHDEYWHVHVDKVTYGSFDYTCLLYLTDYNDDFEGGEFWFENKTSVVGVEPRLGRLSCFTSGAENAHNIAQVTSGRRFALTVAFSCDADAAIADPTGDRAVAKEAVPE